MTISTSGDADTINFDMFLPKDTERLDRVFDVEGIVGSGYLDISGRSLILTNSKSQVSAMWSKEKLDFRKPFKLQAYVYLGNSKAAAADGITLTFQNTSRRFIGQSGSGLGAYGNYDPFSISLEIDTWLNQDGYDEYVDGSWMQHIAIVDSWFNTSQKIHDAAEKIRLGADGKYVNSGISNGYWHALNVSWNPAISELSYELLQKEELWDPGTNRTIVRDKVIKNKKKIEYPGRFSDGAYWGFTSATGAVSARNAIAIKNIPQNLKIETKNSTLYVGQEWRAKDNFVSAVDLRGNSVSFDSSLITVDGDVDTSKPGTHKIKYTIEEEGIRKDSECTVTVKEDQTKAKLKDDKLYVGEKWDLGRVFENVVDKAGNPITPEEVVWVWIDGKEKVKEIDTSKPDKHRVYMAILNAQNKWVYSNAVTVEVKEDKTSLELNTGTHYIYQGEQWEPKRGFKKATDADGNNLSLDKIEKWWGGDKAIDPNKIGDERTYFYRVYKKNGSTIYNGVTVSVKENKTNIKTKDSTLYVGQKWNPEDNFVSATDEEGKEIPWEDSRITKNGASIDTSK
ncbi:hypothetical protein FDP48_14265, partial [Enterococcus faecalis]|uniref:bacterial Ig-like domain-containing protein n=1 Tax=Enterococcus faecalis TaxID=1351 RepID=UPI0012BEB3DB